MQPKLRFKGFTDEWEQRKLGEVATFINGRAYKQNELLDSGKYKVLRVGNFYTNDSWYYSNLELADKYYIDKGDLVYTWSATFGPHIWDGEKVIYHYHIWKIELSKFLDREFTLQILEADKAKLLANTNGSTMIHVTKKDMESKVISLPTIEEQKKISLYLTKFDTLIALYERKIELLSQIKRYFLDNLFAEKDYPNLRFKGFTDAWEQRKLGEILKLYPFKRYIKKPQKCGNYKVIQQGSKPIVGYANGEPFKDYANVILFGDHTLSLYNPHSPFFIATDGVKILGTNQNFESNFLNAILERYKPKSEGYKRHYKILKKQKIYFTTNNDEQSNLGNFFELFDRLVTLYEQKLSHLEELKKYLLQNMFC